MEKFRSKKINQNWLRSFFPVILLLLFYAAIALFWNNISWIASGSVWRQHLSDTFPAIFPRPYVLAPLPTLPAVKSMSQGNAEPKGHAITSGNIGSGTARRRDLITIPKINITAPIITAKTSDNAVIHGLLDSGVVLYPGSTPFGKTGQTVLLGHSAPAGWPKIKYDWVFSKISDLKAGDMIVITYNNETRYYRVVATRIVAPQEGVPSATVGGNSLMIVSCWPPGKDLKRIVVEATILDK